MHLHALLENLSMRVLKVASPTFSTICESWKHQSLEYMGFDLNMRMRLEPSLELVSTPMNPTF